MKNLQKIGYEFYCKELFVVKHKPKYSCESAIYLNLNSEAIKENFKFKFYYNKTDIIPTVLDGGNEMILANWPNDKTFYATLTMTYQSKYPVIHIC